MNTATRDIEARRRRRRRNRVLAIAMFVTASVGLAWFFESQATTTLVFVRHAEKATLPDGDPGLTPAGTQRALELARVLDSVDVVAGVDAVYVSQYRRTAETARPLLSQVGIEARVFDLDDVEGSVNDIVLKHKGKIVLIVGHSDTIAPMIAELGGSKKIPQIAESEYDNLYIVTIPWFGKVKTLRLKFGVPSLSR
ncbi:MAG: phosphoglycerate mutase family protein [Pseudomonadota bacterium]